MASKRPRNPAHMPFDPELLAHKLEQVRIAREKRATASRAKRASTPLHSAAFVVQNAGAATTAPMAARAVEKTLPPPSQVPRTRPEPRRDAVTRASHPPNPVLARPASAVVNRPRHHHWDDKDDVSHDNTLAPSNHHSAHRPASYMPGDAAKRKAERRRTHMPRTTDGMPRSSSPGPDETRPIGCSWELPDLSYFDAEPDVRPPLTAHDRHDWRQASQCGDDSPTIVSLRARKDTSPPERSAPARPVTADPVDLSANTCHHEDKAKSHKRRHDFLRGLFRKP